MAKKTRTELSTLAINTNLPDNTQELITPTTERAQLTDERESVINYKDDLGGTGNAGKFLTVATDGESLTMVDEPSGVPDWVTFITAVRNQMLLKAGGDGTGTTEAWLKFTSYDGQTTAQINFNGIDGSLYINGSQSQMQLSGAISFIIGGTPKLTISSGGNVTIGTAAAQDFYLALRGGVGGFFGWDDSANKTIVQAPNTRSLSFQVNSDTFGSGTEALTISSGGEATFNTTNTFPITIQTTGGNNGIKILTATSKTSWLLGAQYNVDNAFEITPSTAVGGSTFSTPALTISSGGVVSIPNGIVFNNNTTGGTPNATGVTLNDYEEGTYTATLTPSISGSVTLSTNTLAYTRIGRVVTFIGNVIVSSISSTPSPTGYLLMNLPYANGSGYTSTTSITLENVVSGFDLNAIWTQIAGSNVQMYNGTGSTLSNDLAQKIVVGTNIRIFAQYFT